MEPWMIYNIRLIVEEEFTQDEIRCAYIGQRGAVYIYIYVVVVLIMKSGLIKKVQNPHGK